MRDSWSGSHAETCKMERIRQGQSHPHRPGVRHGSGWVTPDRVNRPQWALIYVMDADGSNVHLIEDPSSCGTDPSFTPDGRVLFAQRRVYAGPPNAPTKKQLLDMQICVMNVDGTQEHCLTRDPGENGWRPFGSLFQPRACSLVCRLNRLSNLASASITRTRPNR